MKRSNAFKVVFTVVLLASLNSWAEKSCRLSKVFVPKPGKTESVQSLIKKLKANKDLQLDVEKLTIEEFVDASSPIICESIAVQACPISPETTDIIESKTISIWFDGKKLKSITCDSNQPSEENIENLINTIVRNCKNVDRERAALEAPKFYQKVFKICILGSAVEIIENGCYVPCGNSSWTATDAAGSESARPLKKSIERPSRERSTN